MKSNYKVHVIKTTPDDFEFFLDKGFQILKNTEDFKVSEILWCQEWSDENGFTGESKKLQIVSVKGDNTEGIETGYCVVGTKPYQQVAMR